MGEFLYDGIEFQADQTPEMTWAVRVRLHGETVGTIRREAGTYRYYRMPTRIENMPLYEDERLEVILWRVAERP
jgi:hypothetical protein